MRVLPRLEVLSRLGLRTVSVSRLWYLSKTASPWSRYAAFWPGTLAMGLPFGQYSCSRGMNEEIVHRRNEVCKCYHQTPVCVREDADFSGNWCRLLRNNDSWIFPESLLHQAKQRCSQLRFGSSIPEHSSVRDSRPELVARDRL